MTTWMLAIVLGVTVLLLYTYREPYSGLFLLMGVGLSLVLFSHLFQLLANSFSDMAIRTTGILYNPEYSVTVLGRFKIGYGTLYALSSAGGMLFCLSIPLIAEVYIRADHPFTRGGLAAAVLLSAVIPFAQTAFYSAFTSRQLFQHMIDSADFYQTIQNIVNWDIFLNVALLCFLAFPLFRLIRYRGRCRSAWVRSKTLAITGCLLALILCFTIIHYGSGEGFYFASASVPRALIANAISSPPIATYSNLLPLLMFVVLVVSFVVLFRFRAINVPYRLEDYLYPNSARYLNKRMQLVLHSLKNSTYSQKLLIDGFIANENAQEREAALFRLKAITDKKLAEITRTLDASRSFCYQSNLADMQKCVVQAKQQLPPPSGVSIRLSGDGMPCRVHFLESDLTEVFVNLLQNGYDAILAAEREQGEIVVDIFREQQQVVVHVRDNGIGMTRAVRHKAFVSYFSANGSGRNWGLGLSFVKNAVRKQRGEVLVRSKPGKWTEFELVLPAAEEA